MMKKLISVFIITVMLTCMTIPAHASFSYNYNFSSGADSGEVFGKPTSTDELVSPDPLSENVRRNKDAAYNPPPFGVGSGDIPTDQASLYHDNFPQYSGLTNAPSGSVSYSSFTPAPVEPGGSVSPVTDSDFGGMLPPTAIHSADILNTLPLYYEDGSIGTLYFPKLNLTAKVYSGETLENMRIGVGHFEFTSVWDGNVSIAGHNRGVPAAVGDVVNFASGDKVTYTTRYGTRTYELFNKQQISDTDYSLLGWSDENILTVITCVQNVPDKRWAMQFREVISGR